MRWGEVIGLGWRMRNFSELLGRGELYRVASFSFLFYFILSHVCRAMGIFIFQGKVFFFSNGYALLLLCVFVGGCFIEDEDRSYQDPVIS